MTETGTLEIGEIHPMAPSSMKFVKEFLIKDVKRAMMLREALASAALAGNRLVEVCGETLRRVLEGETVSDRYLLGLAWYLKTYGEKE